MIYRGTEGWAYGGYLDFGGGAPGDGATGSATVIDGALNLRAGPSTADDVLLVVADGAEVALLGDEATGSSWSSTRARRVGPTPPTWNVDGGER